MKIFLKNGVIKKLLIVFIAIIMVSNFIVPNYAYAENKEGSKLVNGFFYLLAWFGDAALSVMQKAMMGTGNLQENQQYAIKYSPGIIFSNTVPALDIDFIGADESYNDTVERKYTDVDSEDDIVKLIEKSNVNSDDFIFIGNLAKMDDEEAIQYGIKYNDGIDGADVGVGYIKAKKQGEWVYLGKWNDLAQDKCGKILSNDIGLLDTIHIYIYEKYIYKIEILNTSTFYIYSCNLSSLTPDNEIINLESTAYKLKNHISAWYNALRTIALVGLLSVLVYIGIRIILSSTSAQDKAKYKNMLKDWLVAICIIFVLHYIMAFMLSFTGKLNNIIKNNVTSLTETGNTTDDLMNSIREKVGDIDKTATSEMAGYTVMYLALVILTGVFTAQYLKRVIFMAFLTMIAPMIALTYPLDKIKDSKAQAFSYWLKEYIFNCLIQPVHLLLYTIFVTNAIDFATDSNPNFLYAIVALGFLVPAEKFVKDMFGMKSESPTGQLGAAAGGAMVMSMLNKIKGKPPKGNPGAGANESKANNIRSASDSSSSSGSDSGTGFIDKNNLKTDPTINAKNSGKQPSKFAQSGFGKLVKGAGGAIGGAVAGGSQRMLKNGANMVTSGVKLTGKAIKAAPGAAVGATIGLVSTVASGGENAAAFIGGGAAAGATLGTNIYDATFGGTGKAMWDGAKKGAYGGEEGYSKHKAKTDFFKSAEYKEITNDSSINQTDIKKRVTDLYDNGITNAKDMKELLQAGIVGSEAKEYKDAGISNARAMREFATNGVNGDRIKKIQTATGETDTKKLQRYNAIAHEAKGQKIKTTKDFVNWAKTSYSMDDEDANKLFKLVQHFM